MVCAGCDEAATSSVPPIHPAIYRATAAQLLDGLRRMSPRMAEPELRRIASAIKRQNDADLERFRAGVNTASSGPSERRSTPHRTPIDVRLMYVEIPSIWARAWSFVKAVLPWSLGRRAPEQVIEARRAACAKRAGGQQCRYLRQEGARLYCVACGCPHTRYSHLGNKTTMPGAECVLGLWPIDDRKAEESGM